MSAFLCSWPRRALRPGPLRGGAGLLGCCLAGASFAQAPGMRRSGSSQPGLSLEAAYVGIAEDSAAAPGLASEQWSLGQVQAMVKEQLQGAGLVYTLGLNSEGGASLNAGEAFANATVKPELTATFSRQVHHLALTGTMAYDQTGFVRSPLSEQWDNVLLTAEQRRRYRYGAYGSDHYFELAPRLNLSLYAYASYLDRGLVTRAYGGGGYLEREMTSLWRLRLGGVTQLFYYGNAEIRSNGPELSSVHQWRETADLEVKAGVTTVTDNTGQHQGLSGRIVLRDEREDYGGRLSWERGVVNRPYTTELTTSDVYSLTLRSQLSRFYGVEANVEKREEEWLRGFTTGTPADALKAELRLIYQTGGVSPWRPERSAWNVVLAGSSEQLQLKTGQEPSRQVLRFGVERVL